MITLVFIYYSLSATIWAIFLNKFLSSHTFYILKKHTNPMIQFRIDNTLARIRAQNLTPLPRHDESIVNYDLAGKETISILTRLRFAESLCCMRNALPGCTRMRHAPGSRAPPGSRPAFWYFPTFKSIDRWKFSGFSVRVGRRGCIAPVRAEELDVSGSVTHLWVNRDCFSFLILKNVFHPKIILN